MKKIRVGEYIEIDSGYAFKSSLFNENEGLPIIRIRDVTSGTVSTYYSGEYDEKYLVNNGDLLISMDGSFIIRKWRGGIALLNQRVCRVKSKKQEVLLDDYIYRILPRYLKQIEDRTPFVTVKHLSVKDINEIEMYLPSIEVQQKIINAIDRSQELIEKRTEQIKACEELIKSQFIEMFGNPIRNEKGWKTSRLDDVCEGIGDGLHGTPIYDSQGKYPFVNGTNLIDGKIVITPNTLYVGEEQYKKHYVRLTNNAILISINGTLGKLAFYEGEEVILGKSACYCNLKEDINKQFVYAVMKNDAFIQYITGAATASTIKNVSLRTMRNFELIMPPIELQNQFAQFVQRVDKLKVEMEQSLIELENNFNALMQRAFKGELF